MNLINVYLCVTNISIKIWISVQKVLWKGKNFFFLFPESTAVQISIITDQLSQLEFQKEAKGVLFSLALSVAEAGDFVIS